MPFQTSVNLDLSYGVPGDFATTAPFSIVPAMKGELTAGSAGVYVARFAWAEDSTGVVSNGKPDLTSTRFGFVIRNQRAVITTYLAEYVNYVQPGMEVALADGGAFLISAPSSATIGQRVFAKYADGTITLGTAGSPPTSTLSVTTTNTSTAISFTGGSLSPGMPISGTGIPAGALVASVNATAGTAVLSAAATASGTVTATVTTSYETRFYVKTAGASGDIIIISDKGF
jgi:hypothetical protein